MRRNSNTHLSISTLEIIDIVDEIQTYRQLFIFHSQGVLPIQYVFSNVALICLENVGSGRNALLSPSIQNRIAASTVFAWFLAGKKDCCFLHWHDGKRRLIFRENVIDVQ